MSRSPNSSTQPSSDGRAPRPAWRFTGRRGTPVHLRDAAPGTLPPEVHEHVERVARERSQATPAPTRGRAQAGVKFGDPTSSAPSPSPATPPAPPTGTVGAPASESAPPTPDLQVAPAPAPQAAHSEPPTGPIGDPTAAPAGAASPSAASSHLAPPTSSGTSSLPVSAAPVPVERRQFRPAPGLLTSTPPDAVPAPPPLEEATVVVAEQVPLPSAPGSEPRADAEPAMVAPADAAAPASTDDAPAAPAARPPDPPAGDKVAARKAKQRAKALARQRKQKAKAMARRSRKQRDAESAGRGPRLARSGDQHADAAAPDPQAPAAAQVPAATATDDTQVLRPTEPVEPLVEAAAPPAAAAPVPATMPDPAGGFDAAHQAAWEIGRLPILLAPVEPVPVADSVFADDDSPVWSAGPPAPTPAPAQERSTPPAPAELPPTVSTPPAPAPAATTRPPLEPAAAVVPTAPDPHRPDLTREPARPAAATAPRLVDAELRPSDDPWGAASDRTPDGRTTRQPATPRPLPVPPMAIARLDDATFPPARPRPSGTQVAADGLPAGEAHARRRIAARRAQLDSVVAELASLGGRSQPGSGGAGS